MFKFNNYKTISLIDKKEWDNCSGKVNPFLSYTFLKNLEDSKSMGPILWILIIFHEYKNKIVAFVLYL